MTIDVSMCKNLFLHVAKGIQHNMEMLNEADSMGDSDHGSGMNRGFKAVEITISTQDFSDLESLCSSIGMAIMMNAGGASGALFGSLFKDGAKALSQITCLDTQSFASFLRLGLEAVMKRGKAVQGDKSLVDALLPATECACMHIHEPIETVIQLCAVAAKQGSEQTKEMVAKIGRMRNVGSRAVGYIDPGSITIALIFHYMNEYLLAVVE